MPLLPSDPQNYNFETVLSVSAGIIKFLSGFAIGTTLIAIIWGAINYFLGGGDAKTAKGKTIVMWAVIGLAVIVLSQIIVVQILQIIQPSASYPSLFNGN